MTLPMLSVLFALLGIVFALGATLAAIASLIYARWDHGVRRRVDIAFALLAGFLAWGWLPAIRPAPATHASSPVRLTASRISY